MANTVALVSVVASSAVAVASLWATVWAGRQQRRHEAALSYEQRIWDRKVDGLFELIAATRRLLDATEDQWFGEQVSRVLDDLDDLVPVVEAFASAGCRDAFERLRETLRNSGSDSLDHMRIELARSRKVEAIDAEHFEEAAAEAKSERQHQQEALDGLTLDMPALRDLGQRVIQEARRSLRGSA